MGPYSALVGRALPPETGEMTTKFLSFGFGKRIYKRQKVNCPFYMKIRQVEIGISNIYLKFLVLTNVSDYDRISVIIVDIIEISIKVKDIFLSLFWIQSFVRFLQ